MIYTAVGVGVWLLAYTVYTLRWCYCTRVTRAYLDGYRDGQMG